MIVISYANNKNNLGSSIAETENELVPPVAIMMLYKWHIVCSDVGAAFCVFLGKLM